MALVNGDRFVDRHLSFAAAGVALSALLAVPGAAAATQLDPDLQADDRQRRGERSFDDAQRVDMEAFRDYEREVWRNVHHPDAVSIFADGRIVRGRDAIVDALRRHFEERRAAWSWSELFRVVHGSETAFILYDTVYEIPTIGFRQHAITGVAYTYERGRWVVVSDQSTPLP